MTAPSVGAVGDARKRDQETHWDPAVRALIAEAVQAERERIAAAIVGMEAFPHVRTPVSEYLTGYGTARKNAARIARDGGR